MVSKRSGGQNAPSSVAYRETQSYDVDPTEATALLGANALESSDGTRQNANSTDWSICEEFKGLPWWRKPSVYWLLGPYLLFTLAFGSIIVPKLNLILDLVCQRYFADQTVIDPAFIFDPVLLGSDNPQCRIPEVQKLSARFFLIMNLCTGILSAVTIPKLGHLSDRYGRRRLMAFVSCGGLMGELITILAANFPNTVDYRWLVLGSIFDGVAGSFTAGSVLCQSYTSDCTPPSKRAVSLGYINACLFGGLAFGPLIAGYFVKWTGSLVSIFYVALGCHIFFIVFTGFVIPESLSKKRRAEALERYEKTREASPNSGSWRATIVDANPLTSLKILWPKGLGTSQPLRTNLVTLALIDTCIMGTSTAVGPIIILYTGYIFGWGTLETSRFVSIVSMVRVVILMGLFPLINYVGRTLPARRKQRAGITITDKNSGADSMDLWVLRAALASEIVGCVGYILARTPLYFVFAALLTSFGALGSATIQATVTKHVPAGRVGQVLGAIGFMHALLRICAPIFFNSLYAATVEGFPQAVFVLLGCLFFVAIVGSVLLKTNGKLQLLQLEGNLLICSQCIGTPLTTMRLSH
ncbi:hypothetical protein S7711_03568 [Stachybotrys chartarum IBT 7711]|uniref:Major facilitator superfamily (MFS) profile domain-containing protein n=1 Tax=Stachybotrys chartarum (strain CBS 109288 / IBT 7711) TaxID=1280523 RepID=A0A084B1S3_STACB|nr:hypothetical protein S7711_03568 [Stachybotrys chartarum IBT 7711]KFA51722.1 hypothetical protein S40293_02803 [Stachybotrys chartarum IBT 40293]